MAVGTDVISSIHGQYSISLNLYQFSLHREIIWGLMNLHLTQSLVDTNTNSFIYFWLRSKLGFLFRFFSLFSFHCSYSHNASNKHSPQCILYRLCLHLSSHSLWYLNCSIVISLVIKTILHTHPYTMYKGRVYSCLLVYPITIV